MSYLSHHGVQGQKWGVRNGPPYPLDKSSNIKNTEMYKRITKEIPDKDHIIKKGTTLNRITDNPDESLKNRRTYVSYTENDENFYTFYKDALFGDSFKQKYKIKLSAIDDMKIANGRSLVQTFVEQVGDKKVSDIDPIEFLKYSDKKFDKAYNQFNRKLGNDNEDSKEYFKRLQNKGYQGMTDIWDSGYAEDPLIIFDAKKSLRKKSISKITREDVKRANKKILLGGDSK